MALKWEDPKDPTDNSWWEYDTAPVIGVPNTLADAQWTGVTGVEVENSAIVGNVARVRISGGTAGQSYTFTLDITSSTGETFQRSAVLKVKEL